MGRQEDAAAQRSKKRNIRLALLIGLVGGATITGIATLGPAVLAGFSVLKSKSGNRLFGSRLKRSLKSLVADKLVTFVNVGGKKHIEITDKGKRYLQKRQIEGYKVAKPRKWDGKWRIVIFDVKEKRRWDRDKLRQELESIGFMHLQHSVWAYPYDCENLITLIKSDFKLGGNVIYMIAEELENDRNLRKRFGLV